MPYLFLTTGRGAGGVLGGKTTQDRSIFEGFRGMWGQNAWKDVFHGAPRLGAPDLARLGRVQPRHALEQLLVVLRRQTWTELSAERNDPGLSRRGEEKGTREHERARADLSDFVPAVAVKYAVSSSR
jgi:hypothetical protein